MRNFIPVIPGKIRDYDNTYTDALTLLGVSAEPIDTVEFNDAGTSQPVAAVSVDGKQYSLKTILKFIGDKCASIADKLDKKAGATHKNKLMYVNTSGNIVPGAPADIINPGALVFASTTEGSTKKFTLSVDDDGEITATEVTA